MMSSTRTTSNSMIYPSFPNRSTMTVGWIALHAVFVAISMLDVKAVLGFQNAEQALAFYGVYHREPMNQLIHFVGVPLIILTAFMAGCHLPILSLKIGSSGGLMPPHYVNWSTVWLLFYIAFYLSIDVVGAIMYAPCLLAMYVLSVRWTVSDQQWAATAAQKKKQPEFNGASESSSSSSLWWGGTGTVLKWALRGHLFAWWVQIVPGHKLIEGAQPALMQSIGGAMTTAPLFAFYEGLWALGIRQDLHHRVLTLVDDYTLDLCHNKGIQMKACPPKLDTAEAESNESDEERGEAATAAEAEEDIEPAPN